MHGGAADRSGLIHVGDEVCEVNGISVEGKTPNDVLRILVCKRNTIFYEKVFLILLLFSNLYLYSKALRVRLHLS